jgi:hypothetical protein
MNNGLVDGRSSETFSHPIDMKSNNLLDIDLGFPSNTEVDLFRISSSVSFIPTQDNTTQKD